MKPGPAPRPYDDVDRIKTPICTATPDVPVKALYEAFLAGFLRSHIQFNGEMGPSEETFRVMFDEWRTGETIELCGAIPDPAVPGAWVYSCERRKGHEPPCEWEWDKGTLRSTGAGGSVVESTE